MMKTKSKTKHKSIQPKSRGRSQQLTYSRFFREVLDVLGDKHDGLVRTKSRKMNVIIGNMIFEEKPDK